MRHTTRVKDGKTHTYWRLVRSVRVGRTVVQQTVAHLGELDAEGRAGAKALAREQPDLFTPSGRSPEPVRVRLDRVRLERGRTFGDVWLGWTLWGALRLDEVRERLLPAGREEVPWATMAAVLVLARLCEPSSELHIAEDLYRRTALEELLALPAALVNDDRCYRALDHLLPHKTTLEQHLVARLGELFGLDYDLLLYDVTSTYFEGQAARNPLARRGHGRDHRPDCPQVCVVLVVTREGLTLGYELFAGNCTDVTTVREIVETMETRYGTAQRIWVMDRGMTSAANLAWLRETGRRYLVGTPKSEVHHWDRQLAELRDWHEVRDGMSRSPRPPTLDPAARTRLDTLWEGEIVPRLVEYVRLPAKSPHFDAGWEAHGFLDRAVALAEAWARGRPIEGLRAETVRLPGRTPVLLVEVPGHADDTVLLYGHLDKQPEMVGWSEGLGPWTPVRRGDRLYGRGAGDDGYAVFAALAAVEALQARGVPHARCVVLIETGEESGSPDLPAYMDALAGRLGQPGLVICLDSSCGSYDRLWGATSLRGLVNGTLSVDVLGEGVHSGAAGGIVPSSFRILRQLLGRLEDERTGEIVPRELHAAVPADRLGQVREVAGLLGGEVWSRYPLVEGMRPMPGTPADLLLANTWQPTLAVIGVAGLPALEDAGNVLRPRTAVKLSVRLPPTVDPLAAAARMQAVLEAEPPYGAHVRFVTDSTSRGWNAPSTAPWLEASLDRASRAHFGQPPAFAGVGGSIPFMSLLGERFPAAQFVITGVLGPGSNAHGPNEFLDLPTARRVTACVAEILADHYASGRRR